MLREGSSHRTRRRVSLVMRKHPDRHSRSLHGSAEQRLHALASRRPHEGTLERGREGTPLCASLCSFCAALLIAFIGPVSTAYGCEGATLAVGTASAGPGERVEVEIRGSVSCEVTGFSFAIGHDPARLSVVDAAPGSFVQDYAGDDLVFGLDRADDSGYAAMYVLFDISAPITVLPTAIPEDTVLATIIYDVLPDAPPGPTPLLNRSRTYGSPNPVANVFSGPPGQAPIEPMLLDGEVMVVGDDGGASFLRGNANSDSGIDLSDAVYLLAFLFQGGPPPRCDDAADSNDDGSLDLSDAIFTLAFLFQGGPPTPEPGPFVPGPDPTPDLLECFIDV